MKKWILIPTIFMSVIFLFFASDTFAQVTFSTTTDCTNLDPSTYSSTTYGGAGSYYDMGTIQIAETQVNDILAGSNGGTGNIVITPPANFQFKTSGVTVSGYDGSDITGLGSVIMTATTCTFSVTVAKSVGSGYAGGTVLNTINISGLSIQCIDANTDPIQGLVTFHANSPLTVNGASNGSITVSLSGNLPVELNSFSGSVSGNVVTLKWSTATEVNNYGFDVQRSTDNKAWTKVGFVPGSGNSNSPKDYSFTDQPSGASSFSYRLKQIDVGGAFKYYDAITVNISGGEAQLLQNSPNPFNPTTTIKYYIPEERQVTLTIYDMLGREVTTLVNKQADAGYHIVYWNGKDRYGESVASGIYLYRLQAGSFIQTKKMIMLK